MWIWLWLWYFSNRIYLNRNWNRVLVCEATQLKISIKRRRFSWHLDRNCPLKTLEKAFQSIKSSKFSGVACPLPLVWARTLSAPVHSLMIEKCLDFTYSKGWTVCVVLRFLLGKGSNGIFIELFFPEYICGMMTKAKRLQRQMFQHLNILTTLWHVVTIICMMMQCFLQNMVSLIKRVVVS